MDSTKENILKIQGERGHWNVYYTGLQSFISTFSHSLAYNYGTFIEF